MGYENNNFGGYLDDFVWPGAPGEEGGGTIPPEPEPYDQGVVHLDLHAPWTRPSGSAGDGNVANTDFDIAKDAGYLLQFGSGVLRLDTDVSGPSNAGIGFGQWQEPLPYDLTIAGRGPITRLVYSNAPTTVDNAAMRVGDTDGHLIEYRDFVISSEFATGSIDLIRGETTRNFTLRNVIGDGRSAIPNESKGDVVSTTGTTTTLTNIVGHPNPDRDGVFVGSMAVISGPGIGQEVTVSAWAGATLTATHDAWTPVTPTSASRVVLWAKGNYNPETGVKHISTPLHLKSGSRDCDANFFQSFFAGGHGMQISQKEAPAFDRQPERFRFRSPNVYDPHGSGINTSGLRDFVLTSYHGRQNIAEHGAYRSGYGGLRIGNGGLFHVYDSILVDGFWRNIRLVDTQHYLCTTVMSKNAGFLALTINGKDTLNIDGTILGFKAYNSCRFVGHSGLVGDDDEDEPEQTGASNTAMFGLTDGDPTKGGHHFSMGFVSSNDDMIYPGLGKIITTAGSEDFVVIDNFRTGQAHAGPNARIHWRQKDFADPAFWATYSWQHSNIYTGEHIQKATLLGRAFRYISITYWTLANGGGTEITDPDNYKNAGSTVNTCKFDSPCPVTIGNAADYTTGDPWYFRNCARDFMYFCPAAGDITTTLNSTAATGAGTGFVVEPGPAITNGTSRVHLYTAPNPKEIYSIATVVSTVAFTLPSNASAVDGYYVGWRVKTPSGVGRRGEEHKVIAYVGATRQVTVDAAWKVALVPDLTVWMIEGGLGAERMYLGELVAVPSATSATLKAPGARRTYTGPYCFTVEQKVATTLTLVQGPKEWVFDHKSIQFNGYSRNPVTLRPDSLKKNQWPRSVVEIPGTNITTAPGLFIPIPIPEELLNWRSGVIAYLDVQFQEDFTGNATNYLILQMRRARAGSITLLGPILNLTDVSKLEGQMVSVPIGASGPFDFNLPANYYRFGSDQHDEVPDGIKAWIQIVGTGGYMPTSLLYIGWCSRWMVGA